MGKMLLKLTLLFALASIATGFEDNKLYGISHIGMTVKNLDLSTRYYQEIFGATLIDELSTGDQGVYGDSHFYRMFQKEELEGQNVPDIRSRGTHEVRWNFLLMQNFMIMLMEFRNRATRQVYFNEAKEVGNLFIGSSHGCLAANLDIVPFQQMEDIIERQQLITDMDADKRDFIAYFGADPADFKERNARPLSTKLLPFAPNFMLASMRGPIGEKWELSYRRGNGLLEDVRSFCKYKGAYPAMLDLPLENEYQKFLSQQMGGLNHINAVVDDMDKTVYFYTRILGGKINSDKSSSGVPLSKPFFDLIHQDEILEAKKIGRTPDLSFGILPEKFEGPSQPLVDIFFITFDNTYFEAYRYYMNDSYDGVPPNLYRSWSGPAWTNNMQTGFWLKENENPASFIKDMERKAKAKDMPKVKANRAVAVSNLGDSVNNNQYTDPFPAGHRFEGFDYTFFKGPSGEQNVLVQFKGKAATALQGAMERYGAMSTAFPSTNPWNWAGFNKTCEWVEEEDKSGGGNFNTPTSVSSKAVMFLPLLLIPFLFINN